MFLRPRRSSQLYFVSRVIACVLLGTNITALSATPKDELSSFLFVDSYVATSKNEPPFDKRQYVTQASHLDEPRLNLIALGGTYDDGSVRGAAIGQYGDSSEINYSAEPHEGWRYVQESYIGGYLTDTLTLDGGVFLSHLGGEGWMSKDNPTYTRSLIAEQSPYYQTGLRLLYRVDDAWSTGLFVLNGWQNISDKRHPALGTQVTYRNSGTEITSNSFIGDEDGGARLFHDLVTRQAIGERSTLMGAIDVGYQDADTATGGWWWGYAAIWRTAMTTSVAINARFESYQDPNNAIVTTNPTAPFRIYATSIGSDITLGHGLTVRGEVKYLTSPHDIFLDENNSQRDDLVAVLSLSYLVDTITK